jgi:hypothetical protein
MLAGAGDESGAAADPVHERQVRKIVTVADFLNCWIILRLAWQISVREASSRGQTVMELVSVQPRSVQSPDTELRALIHRFRDVIALRPHVPRCFTEQGIQVEGWLKGEFLSFLTDEKCASRIVNFNREALIGVGKRKADLCLGLRDGLDLHRIWIELKHLLIGLQKGIAYNAFGYFNDPVAIKPDVDKLLAMSSPHKYMLLLTTARPSTAEWMAAIARFNVKFQPCLRSLTDPSDFPDEFFLGLISVAHHPTV